MSTGMSLRRRLAINAWGSAAIAHVAALRRRPDSTYAEVSCSPPSSAGVN